MKHLRKFEELDYKAKLAAETKIRQDYERSEEERVSKKRSETEGKYLSQLKDEKVARESDDKSTSDRKAIIQKVIDGIVKDQNNDPGYQTFKEELLIFLSEFPKE